MRSKTLSAILSALLLVPAVAWAQPAASQNLTFTTISSSGFSGHPTAEQKVITTTADYKALFVGAPPASPTVDFTKEEVLAVFMGTEPTGGYATKITRVEYMTIGITGGTAFVHYTESRPPVGVMVPQVITTPMHVVKLDKKAAKYIFVNDSATTAAAWDKLSFNVSWAANGTSATVELTPNGGATLYQSSPTGKYAPLPGTASAAELKAVNDAFKNADVTTLPANVVDDRVFIMAPKTMQLQSTVAGKTYVFSASLDYYKTFDARVKPLADALKAISDRLAGGTATQNFDKLTLSTEGGFILHRDDFVVAWDGTVTVLDRVGMGPTRPFTGHATKAELQAIVDAFRACDVTTLPDNIQPSHLIPDIASTRLVSSVNGKDYDTLMVQGAYGTYEARLKPLVEAIRACGARVQKDVMPQTITDVVSFTANVLKVGTYTVAKNDTLYGTIFSLRGKNITIVVTGATGVEYVLGTTTTTASLRKYAAWWGQSIETVQKGSQVQITGRSTNGLYYMVNSPSGQKGWLYASYVNAAN